jgi:DNA polymerase III subunit delta
MIYFLYGSDTYRSRGKLKELVQKNSDGFNVQKIDGSKISTDELNKNIATNDLFSQKKFLIVEGVASKDSKAKEDVVDFLRNLEFDNSSFLIFYDAQVDKRSVTFKVLNKKADEAYAFDELKPAEMDIWLQNQIKHIGLNINNENFKKLAISLGSDTWLAIGELGKLKAYKGNEEVLYEDIDLLVRGKLDDDIFKLTDMIVNNNKKEAVKLLKDQLELGSNEIYLLTMIVRQFRILIQLKSVNSFDAAKILKLHPFVVQKSLPMVRKYSMEQLKDIYRKLLEIDLKLKSSKVSGETLLETFILEI